MIELIQNYSIPGFAGGTAIFLYGIRNKHYKNNQYFVKFIVEIGGSTITATFLSSLFFIILKETALTQFVVPFLIGLGWAKIIHAARHLITKKVMDAIKNHIR